MAAAAARAEAAAAAAAVAEAHAAAAMARGEAKQAQADAKAASAALATTRGDAASSKKEAAAARKEAAEARKEALAAKAEAGGLRVEAEKARAEAIEMREEARRLKVEVEDANKAAAAATAAAAAAAAIVTAAAAAAAAAPPPAPLQTAEQALQSLRSKVDTKLGHTLEAGWHVQWEEVHATTPGSKGLEGGVDAVSSSASWGKRVVRFEKVFFDPMTPGLKLYGDALALTHVKARLAMSVQAEAARVKATKEEHTRCEREFKSRLDVAVASAVEEERRKAKSVADVKKQKADKAAAKVAAAAATATAAAVAKATGAATATAMAAAAATTAAITKAAAMAAAAAAAAATPKKSTCSVAVDVIAATPGNTASDSVGLWTSSAAPFTQTPRTVAAAAGVHQTPTAAVSTQTRAPPASSGPAPAAALTSPERAGGVKSFLARHMAELRGEPASLDSLLECSAAANFAPNEVLSVLSMLVADTPQRAATHMVTIHEI